MDQIKIGKFISECRKKENLTQSQLAEKLSVTDRAVSKWERGKSMPDPSIMLDLCEILKISVNDLLCGERVKMENKNEKLEQTLLETVKQKVEADKRLLLCEIVFGVTFVVILLVACVMAAYAQVEEWVRVVFILVGLIPLIVALPFMIKIEQTAGYYKCKHCNHTYVPSFKSVFFAMHMGRTRYMKCPKCGKWSWQKKVIEKE